MGENISRFVGPLDVIEKGLIIGAADGNRQGDKLGLRKIADHIQKRQHLKKEG